MQSVNVEKVIQKWMKSEKVLEKMWKEKSDQLQEAISYLVY